MHGIQAHKGVNSWDKNYKGFFYLFRSLKVSSATQEEARLCKSSFVVELAELR